MKTPMNIDDKVKSRFWEKVTSGEGCWVWTGAKTSKGYGSFRIGGRRGKAYLSHRVSYTILIGEIPDGAFVCHHCDNPSCVRPDHLFLGSAADNSQDMERKKRTGRCYGERNGKATFSFEKAQEIRRLRQERGFSYRTLARNFGIGSKTVWRILHNLGWTRPR